MAHFYVSSPDDGERTLSLDREGPWLQLHFTAVPHQCAFGIVLSHSFLSPVSLSLVMADGHHVLEMVEAFTRF